MQNGKITIYDQFSEIIKGKTSRRGRKVSKFSSFQRIRNLLRQKALSPVLSRECDKQINNLLQNPFACCQLNMHAIPMKL